MQAIKDRDFKMLKHSFTDYSVYKTGQELAKGYKPDYVLANGNDFIILESESKTDRKAYLGALIKAAHFLQGENTGMLVFVILERGNTNLPQIVNHLKPYYEWIQDKTNLREIFLIESGTYFSSGQVMSLDCEEFLRTALKIKR